jgi:serine protease Do
MTRLVLIVLLVFLGAPNVRAQVPAAFDKPVPESIADLQEIEEHVQRISAKVMPATVCLRIGNAQGSGVIIDRDGRILTAGHVSGEAGREATVIFPDGRRAKGRTLGANNNIDSGMVILTERIDFTHVPMAKSADVKRGQWCLSLGHPGGYKQNRPPVVRLGRIQGSDAKAIMSDCALVGGDSGGPLFDMHGRVIGIHSRIGGKVSSNVHVPIGTYHDTWTKLAAGDVWGSPFPLLDFLKQTEPYLGVRAFEEKRSLKIENVTPGSPADKAGLKVNDVILKIDNQAMNGIDEFSAFLKTKRPGAQVNVLVRRGEQMVTAAVTLEKRK